MRTNRKERPTTCIELAPGRVFVVARFRIADLLWLTLAAALVMAWARFLPTILSRHGPTKAWHPAGESIVALGFGTLGFVSLRTGWICRIVNWFKIRRIENGSKTTWRRGFSLWLARLFPYMALPLIFGFMGGKNLVFPPLLVSGSVVTGCGCGYLAIRGMIQQVRPTNPIDIHNYLNSPISSTDPPSSRGASHDE